MANKPSYQVKLVDEDTGVTYGPYIGTVVTLGRFSSYRDRYNELDPTSTLVLPHPAVSNRHCEVDARGIPLTVRDLNSKNGTYVNGVRVEGEALLRDGDRLNLGKGNINCLNVIVERDLGDSEVIRRNSEIRGFFRKFFRFRRGD